VRLLRTGVENGFIIFLIATDAPVNWSFAELRRTCQDKPVNAGPQAHTKQDRMHLSTYDEPVVYASKHATHPFRRVEGRHNV